MWKGSIYFFFSIALRTLSLHHSASPLFHKVEHLFIACGILHVLTKNCKRQPVSIMYGSTQTCLILLSLSYTTMLHQSWFFHSLSLTVRTRSLIVSQNKFSFYFITQNKSQHDLDCRWMCTCILFEIFFPC